VNQVRAYTEWPNATPLLLLLLFLILLLLLPGYNRAAA
jgi:hypothetical protein